MLNICKGVFIYIILVQNMIEAFSQNQVNVTKLELDDILTSGK